MKFDIKKTKTDGQTDVRRRMGVGLNDTSVTF